jgi:hypothetical protein
MAFLGLPGVLPAPDLGSAFYNSQAEVMASGEADVAGSFNLLGDPMAPVPGHAVVSAVGDNAPVRASTLLLSYPNPFNPTTNVRYYLASQGAVTIRIYNVAGQLVDTLIDGMQPAGFHTIAWTPAQLASGIYFCRLSTGTISQTRKLVLLK